MILMIDNYDSFTFNLVQALEATGAAVRVLRNDAIDRSGLEALADDPSADLRGIVISPGPGNPDSAGVSMAAIRFAVERKMPLLGVCLVVPETLPAELVVTARTEGDDVVMGIRHTSAPMEGVQFHPESVLTPMGPHLLANFLRLAGEGEAGLLDDVAGSFAMAGIAEEPNATGAAVSSRVEVVR